MCTYVCAHTQICTHARAHRAWLSSVGNQKTKIVMFQGTVKFREGVASWSVNMIDMQDSGTLPSKVAGGALRDNVMAIWHRLQHRKEMGQQTQQRHEIVLKVASPNSGTEAGTRRLTRLGVAGKWRPGAMLGCLV